MKTLIKTSEIFLAVILQIDLVLADDEVEFLDGFLDFLTDLVFFLFVDLVDVGPDEVDPSVVFSVVVDESEPRSESLINQPSLSLHL